MNKKMNTKQLTGLALFTAITIILQVLGSFIHFGTFSVSLVLVPIVVGAALYGVAGGAWLGFVFSVAVILSGDAATFLAINVVGTFITVIVKGTCAGLCAGLVYKALSNKNKSLAVLIAAIVAPVVNTGIFLICCRIFFFPTIIERAGATNVYLFMLVGFVGGNFLFELLFNIVLSPVIVRLINIGRKM